MNVLTTLQACDRNYGEQHVKVNSKGKEAYVVSDLHLASGLNANNNYDGTENFFSDDSFIRFINHIQSFLNGKQAILVINGDFIDFLRIRNIPDSDADFLTWERILNITGIKKTVQNLKESIVKKELEYGLKTNDYKSVWKLHICTLGHKKVFERMALWLYDGNDIVITKGNHDLEWYWAAVRNYLRYYLADCIAARNNGATDKALSDIVAPQLQFADHAVIIDGKIYIEHGHRFDNTTAVQGEPLLANKEEINLPFGSFFNRYLINRLELTYPFLDNVRPTQNILLVLLRERFPLAIKVLFHYIPFMLLIIPKKLYWETFKYLLHFLLIILLPVLITAYAVWQSSKGISLKADPSFISQQILSVIKNAGFLFLSYLFGRLLVFVQLKPPASFYPDAVNIFLDYPELKVISFGHTHNPEQKNDRQKAYLNTGTWIPVYESSSADVRIDKTFTFLYITQNEAGMHIPSPLQRWDDDAMRIERLILTDKK